MPREHSIARGMVCVGLRTSPPMAAMRSNPCMAMNVKPIA